jgi:hypothetical protein
MRLSDAEREEAHLWTDNGATWMPASIGRKLLAEVDALKAELAEARATAVRALELIEFE